MILKYFLMGFGGISTATGVGIEIYYGINSSENARKEVQALALTNPVNEKKDEEKDNENDNQSQSGSSDTRVSNDTDNSPLGEGSSLNTRGQNKK